MQIRTIKCDVAGCKEELKEENFGNGFKGWGTVKGKYNPETGADEAHLCPKHLDLVFSIIENGGNNYGLDRSDI